MKQKITMKKIIISILTVVIGFSMFAPSAFADSSFNSGVPIGTITVTNATTQPCSAGPINGCWKPSTSAIPGDVIAVQVFYANTSNETATDVTLSIQPSRNANVVTFNGGVAATNGPRSTGSAVATLSQTTTITYMEGGDGALWYPNGGQGTGHSVSPSALFGSSGFNIGNVAPGEQGVLVARFRVNGTAPVVYQQPPVVYQPPYVTPVTNTQPQAITTVATGVSGYGATLNGIAVPNINYGTTSAWFEYGNTTTLGSTSDRQSVSANQAPYSTTISGLVPGATYYYRAVVQNQNGTAYGSVVSFRTTSVSSVYVPPVRVVQSQTVTRTTNTGITANSQPSLFKLEVDSSYDHMCIGGNIDYTVNYQNISTQDLQNSILRVTFPGELTYASSSTGSYDVTDRTLTISLGDVQPGEQGSVTVHAQVNDQAVTGKLAVITATMVYTNPASHAQEQAIAYSLITVSNDCPSVLGASVFGFAGFLPQTLLQWLLLILVILALIVLARSFYHKKDEQAK